VNRALLVALLLTACTRSNEPPLVNPGVSSARDSCGVLPHGCGHEDGCPDTVLPLGDECALSQQSLYDLDRATRELHDTPLLTKLVVVAPSLVCANAIRAVFEARGIEEGRVQVAAEGNRSFASFEVLAWNERDCATGAPSKLPVK
jgi:hypothetical protein